MIKSSEQSPSKETPKASSRVEGGNPIDSWDKEQFIEYGKYLLKKIKELAPDVTSKNYGRSIFVSTWIESIIKDIYRYMKRAKFSLEDIGTSEEELKEMIAPSSGFVRPLTERERNEIWQQIFEESK